MTLAELLDNVPSAELRAALDRRKALASLTPEQSAAVCLAVRTIAETHGVSPQALRGTVRDATTAGARHALYARLYREGWKPTEIAAALGHDRTRVYHGLKKLGIRQPQYITRQP